jgi:hypothetical protein
MEQSLVFIYAKGNQIKVLSLSASLNLDGELKKDGWVHTHTIDACLFIQYLHDQCERLNFINEMKNFEQPN